MRFALGVIDDHRRLIAAGKTHRWDIVKWAVTINVALAGASVTLVKLQSQASTPISNQLMFFLIAVGVFLLTICLMWEVTRRMTAARNDSRKPLEYLARKQIDVLAVTGEGVPPPYPQNYDWQESRNLHRDSGGLSIANLRGVAAFWWALSAVLVARVLEYDATRRYVSPTCRIRLPYRVPTSSPRDQM